MKPAAVRYLRPRTVPEALSALQGDPDAKILAGGQSLVALMNMRLARPSLLVDIGRLSELDRILEDDDALVVGAMVRHATVSSDPRVSGRVPLMAEAARHIGHVAIRNRGTLGGTLAHADPAAELPLVMVTTGATFYVDSLARGRREISAADFFRSFYSTSLEADEMLCWVRIPTLRAGEGWGFVEFARRHGDFAMVGAAALLGLGPDSRVVSLRVGALGVDVKPLLLDIPPGIMPSNPGPDTWIDLADHLSREMSLDDDYKQALLRTALERALAQATGRATGTLQRAGGYDG